MANADTKVLAAGIERGTFEHLAPVLRRGAVQVDWVETPEAGVDIAGEHRYDVILMDAVPCDWPLEKVVRSFRDPSSPSRGAAILVLAEPDQVDVARALRSRGVNRVMLVTIPRKSFAIRWRTSSRSHLGSRYAWPPTSRLHWVTPAANFLSDGQSIIDRDVDQDPAPPTPWNTGCLQDSPSRTLLAPFLARAKLSDTPR